MLHLLQRLTIHKIIYGNNTVNADRFKTFIEELLEKLSAENLENSFLIMNNAKIHKHPDIKELIEDNGFNLKFLPPYNAESK